MIFLCCSLSAPERHCALLTIPVEFNPVMKKILSLIAVALFVLGAISVYWGATHYLIQTRNGFLVVSKRFITLKNTFLDVRDWQEQDFNEHAPLRNALRENGYDSLLKNRPSKDETEQLDERDSAGAKAEHDKQNRSNPAFSSPEKDPPRLEVVKRKIRQTAESIKQWISEVADGEENRPDESGQSDGSDSEQSAPDKPAKD